MKNSELLKKDAADILRASLIALILSLLLVLVFALIVRWASLDGTALTVGNYVIKAVSVLVGVTVGFRSKTGVRVRIRRGGRLQERELQFRGFPHHRRHGDHRGHHRRQSPPPRTREQVTGMLPFRGRRPALP